MSRKGVIVLAVLIPGLSQGALNWDDMIMVRGDLNRNGRVDMTDAVMINSWLFSGGPAPPCLNQADANDDGRVDVSDSTFILNWLFSGGPAPPSPGPYGTACRLDPGINPGCIASPCS